VEKHSISLEFIEGFTVSFEIFSASLYCCLLIAIRLPKKIQPVVGTAGMGCPGGLRVAEESETAAVQV